MLHVALAVAAATAPPGGVYQQLVHDLPIQRRDHGSRGTFVEDGSEAADSTSTTPTCTISKEEHCDLSSMKKDEAAYVRPGGKTRCIFERTGAYQFEVIPGDSDKLLIFFQGGGACWDVVSTIATACTTGAFGQGTKGGVFERNEPSNPYRHYTVLHVLYCDGSMFAGNVTQDYLGAVQTGYENAMSAFAWVKDQIARGQLASTLSSLVISGCSAGSVRNRLRRHLRPGPTLWPPSSSSPSPSPLNGRSRALTFSLWQIGAQLWADHALTHLAHENAAVIPDSYMGVFPTEAEAHLIDKFQMCTTPLLDPLPRLKALCRESKLSLHAVTAAVIAKHPHAVFAQVQSKADSVQIGFDWALSADPLAHPSSPLQCTDKQTCFVTPESLYSTANDYLEQYDANANHVHFLVQSSQHCYLPNGHFYEADPSGSSSGGHGGETLTSWVGRLPLLEGGNISTRCHGGLAKKAEWKGDKYCDAAMAGKVITKGNSSETPVLQVVQRRPFHPIA
jgi:hypothetical protein